MNDMSALDIARRLAELGRKEDACKAYTLAIAEAQGKEPEAELEGALYILRQGGSYKVAYDAFRRLHREGPFREEVLAVMTEAFYLPNVKRLKGRYEKNRGLLEKYPYLFRRDFPDFEELPLRFYPYDDNSYLPYDVRTGRFGDAINFNHPVVSRNFFSHLDKPILAADVYSMYELSYLNDNVRRSEDIGRENHLYLHYTGWTVFCAHLAVLNLRPLLADKKIVFLMEEEVERYPIDFKARFGVDYSQYPVRPIGIRDIHRLIWHTQLATHNGGDFFNEILDGHPNLIAVPSIMLSMVMKQVDVLREAVRQWVTVDNIPLGDQDEAKKARVLNEFYALRTPTEKDAFVAFFLCLADLRTLDQGSRIAPAIFFQPHFPNMVFSQSADSRGRTVLSSPEYDQIRTSPIFKAFPYIKTFTPMRRPTTSTAASIRFMDVFTLPATEDEGPKIMSDVLAQRVLNRSFMVDWQDRLYQDSVLVRFEDGKLNPKATFTALAAFVDLPYTESMTYCSFRGQRDPESLAGNDLGFSPAAIYRTYDEYMGTPERVYLEYLLRDAYEYYGYDFHYYDGSPMDEERMRALIDGMTVINSYIAKSFKAVLDVDHVITIDGIHLAGEVLENAHQAIVEVKLDATQENRLRIARLLMMDLRFVNSNGQPLNMMPRLKLDPALLEQPLYH